MPKSTAEKRQILVDKYRAGFKTLSEEDQSVLREIEENRYGLLKFSDPLGEAARTYDQWKREGLIMMTFEEFQADIFKRVIKKPIRITKADSEGAVKVQDLIANTVQAAWDIHNEQLKKQKDEWGRVEGAEL